MPLQRFRLRPLHLAFIAALSALMAFAFAPPPWAARAAAQAPQTFDLRDFGAAGDGTTDDAPALQAALDALAAAGGGTLDVPAGQYVIASPVHKDFAGLADSITIRGVSSDTIVDTTGTPTQLATGLQLVSEFYPRTREAHVALRLKGLGQLLVTDIAFVGTPGVPTDAASVVTVEDVGEAVVRHCEFYGLSTLVGAVVHARRSGLHVEQTKFLGTVANSGIYAPVVDNLEWKSVALTDVVFLDYGLRPELFGKTGFGAPYSWVNVGNAAAVTADSPRREVSIRRVFLDEGGYVGLSSLPFRYQPATAPVDLYYITGLRMNVSNLRTTGNYFDGLDALLVENSRYGWSTLTNTAIYVLRSGHAILDRIHTEAAPTTLRADSSVGSLTVINSVYENLASQAGTTRVIETEEAADDPVRHVRERFASVAGREPDPAAHYYWSRRLLACAEGDAACTTSARAALAGYLAQAPAPKFAIEGVVSDEQGGALAGVTLTLNGSQAVSTVTDAAGRYRFSNLPTSGVYTVTAAKRHYTFPAPFVCDTPAGDRTADFAATLNRHRISGRVATADNRPLAGVTLALNGSQSATATTDAAGAYSFANLPAGGNYAVTPSKTGHTFAPQATVTEDLSGDRTANFAAVQSPAAEFGSSTYSVGEAAGAARITVVRNGNTADALSVVYSATDGTAKQGRDLITVIGRLNFAPGETSKSFEVFITDDAYLEGAEQLILTLRAPSGTAALAAATLIIEDNEDGQDRPNPVDETAFFVRQHYLDFLGREPDAAGLAFWVAGIESCGLDAPCRQVKRADTSAAFFLSVEFQETGFLVYRLYKASDGRPPHRVEEFLFDSRLLAEGVIVGAPGWAEKLAANKRAFYQRWVQRPGFGARFDSLGNAAFVDALFENMRVTPTAEEREAVLADLSRGVPRHEVLAKIVEGEQFARQEMNPAFVLMQYFGYLRREPAEPGFDGQPDPDLDGYNFWLRKLADNRGDWRAAEMVRAFIESIEYRQRFGQ